MRVSTPAEMTTIDITALSCIIRIFEYELHCQKKNLNNYEVHVSIPERLKNLAVPELFDEIARMYICSGWNQKTNIVYDDYKNEAILELYK